MLHLFYILSGYNIIPECMKKNVYLKILNTVPHNEKVKRFLQIY